MSSERSSRATRIRTASGLRKPILDALGTIGGQAPNGEVVRRVAGALGLSDEDLAIPHKNARLIERVASAVWALKSGA